MKPIDFPQKNVVLAKDQPEYLPLPVFYNAAAVNGEMISCWKLSFAERVKMLFSGKLWIVMMTFHSSPQPVLPTMQDPFEEQK